VIDDTVLVITRTIKLLREFINTCTSVAVSSQIVNTILIAAPKTQV